MPASMISAPTGGRPKVIGSSIAMVATEPTEQNVEWIGRDLEAHPEVREKVRHDLLTPESVEARPKLERQVEQVDEQQHAEQSHQRRGDRAFDPPHFR